MHLQTTPVERPPAILARVQAITTRAQALEYIEEMAGRLEASEGSPATG